MTPHSERDEYPVMDSNPVKAKPSRVRPVVPLKYTQNTKTNSFVSVPADRVVPAVKFYEDAIASPSVTVPASVEKVKTQVVDNHAQDIAISSKVERSFTDASLDLDSNATTETVLETSQASTQTDLDSSATESELKLEELEPNPKVIDPPEGLKETESSQQTSEATKALRDMQMYSSRPDQVLMPPPGFQQISLGTDNQPRRNANGYSINGDMASASPARESIPNGIMSPPPETLVNAPAFVPGHSHHMSNSGTPITPAHPQAIFPPPGFEAHPPAMMANSTFPPFDPRTSVSFNADVPVLNGGSQPGSRAMSHSSRGRPDIVSPQEEIFRHSFNHTSVQSQDMSNGRLRNGSLPMPPIMAPLPPQPDIAIDSALMIREYLLSQFGSPDLADYILQVFRGEERLLSIPVHSLLAVRSPTLFKLITDSRYANDGSRILKLKVTDGSFVEQAFIEALQSLYGAPLAHAFIGMINRVPPFSTRDLTGDTAQFARQVLSHALSLVNAGTNLQLETVVIQGAELAKRVIRWDTLEVALTFILADGLPQGWRGQDSEGTLERLQGLALLSDNVKSQLLREVVDYLAVNFPHHFEFNASGSQLEGCPRLPMILDAKPSVSNHRLSRIQFGQLPAEQPDFVTSSLSSILMTLPFEVLKTLFGHPALVSRGKSFQLVSTVESVFVERENRRNKVLQSKRISPRGEGSLWEATQWQESTLRDPQMAGGVTINRQRVEK